MRRLPIRIVDESRAQNVLVALGKLPLPVGEGRSGAVGFQRVLRVVRGFRYGRQLVAELARRLAVGANEVIEPESEQHRKQMRRISELLAQGARSGERVLDFTGGIAAS